MSRPLARSLFVCVTLVCASFFSGARPALAQPRSPSADMLLGHAPPQRRPLAARADAASVPATGIGSPNTVSVEPPLARPRTTPCRVRLFTNVAFADFNAKPFAYVPTCRGPWSKVIFEAAFRVTAGVQFDRTAQVSLGHANLFYGTTPEPSQSFGPTWHVERDVTDDAALFASPHDGEADLGNLVDATYTGVIFGTAELVFYPAGPAPPARGADVVVPIPDEAGGAGTLASSSSEVSQVFSAPRNVERAYLDVVAQSQSSDEFWYTCVPSDVAAELFSCPGGSFREVEITLDGLPAGFAPVYPWIYTGGIDPFLWFPIPGVQTLDFAPFRVDLSPFAALLSDGRRHRLALAVAGADNYFLAAANLLLYLDRGSAHVTGGLERDSIVPPPVAPVRERLSTSGGNVTGTVEVGALQRAQTLEGYANTSHGRVDTTVAARSWFDNVQAFDITSAVYAQHIVQGTQYTALTTVRDSGGTASRLREFFYPLTVDISEITASGGTTVRTTISQEYLSDRRDAFGKRVAFESLQDDRVAPTDLLLLDANFNLLGNADQKSSQRFDYADTTRLCYRRALAAADNVLTADRSSSACGDEVARAIRDRIASARRFPPPALP